MASREAARTLRMLSRGFEKLSVSDPLVVNTAELFTTLN